jgi:beta-glucosidase
MDNECIDFTAKVTDDHDYAPYIEAVKKGYLKESDIDVALRRLFTARMKLGMFDPPEMVPYSKIDEKLLDGPEHRAMARKLANESMTLLKNDGVLPLKTSGAKIAVVGPLADQTPVLLGNYNGIPTHTVSVLEGLRAEFSGAQIRFVPGTQFLSKEASPVPSELLNTDGNPGVRASYYALNDMFALLGRTAPPVPLAIRTEPGIGLSTDALPPEIAGKNLVVVVWEAALMPQATGDYNFGLRGEGFFRVSINGTPVTMAFNTNGAETKLGRVHFEAGKMYALKVEYGVNQHASEAPRLVWAKRVPGPTPEAIAAAKDADVVVAVVGITSELEGEEMLVSEEGFKGGDRTSLDLPKSEQDLLEGVASTGKPLVVVLLNGSALSVNWVKEHANAILESWYPGEEGGAAIAQTLAGVNNPSGRLPVTFYTGVDQLPPFEDYSMANRTYRYFTGTALYPFGYGLSYSKFAYSKVKLSSKKLHAGDPLNVDADVKNTSQRDGDEVVELYLTFPKLPGAPLRALRGFTRVHVRAGKTAHVRLALNSRDLSYVNENGDRIIAPGSYSLSIGGGQPGTAAPVVESAFTITGQTQLPE